MFPLWTVLLLVNSIFAQKQCSGTNYQPCLDQNDLYISSTCNTFKANNITQYQLCLCYADFNRNLCFDQCPGNPVIKTTQLAFQAKFIADCAAVGLNALSLPPSPFFTPTSTMNAGPSMTASTTSATASSTEVSNESYKSVVGGLVYSILVLSFF